MSATGKLMPLDLSSQPELALPFESTRALLTKWRSRDADKTAIVDLDQDGKSISWGEIRPAKIAAVMRPMIVTVLRVNPVALNFSAVGQAWRR